MDGHVVRVGVALAGLRPLGALDGRVSAAGERPVGAQTARAPAEHAHVRPVGGALIVGRPAGARAASVLAVCGRVRSAQKGLLVMSDKRH